MLQMNAIRKMTDEEKQTSVRSSIYTVPKKNGKRRPVINLRWLNQHVIKQHFKMTTMRDVRASISPGCWMASIDLSDCFWGLPVHKDHQRFLAFDWEGVTYCFQVLPFGLGPSPWFITKLYRHVVERLHQCGHQAMIYIDDLLIIGETKQACEAAIEAAMDLFADLGAIVNTQKSQLLPTQTIEYLGFQIDSVKMMITAPKKKMENIKKAIRSAQKQLPSARSLASILGKINSLQDALLASRIHTTGLHTLKLQLASQGSWDRTGSLTQEAAEDLQWWKDNVHSINGKSLLPQVVDLRAATDASDYGWGTWIETPTGVQRWGGLFNSDIIKNEHINYKELLAVKYLLESSPVDLRDKTLELGIDNTTAMWYLRKTGGRKAKLARLTDRIWNWLLARNVKLKTFHLPGIQNLIADEESRFRKEIHVTDLMVNHQLFKTVNRLWGPCSIDLFATFENRQLPRFASVNPQPGAVWVDAMRHSWLHEMPWANPPFALLGRVIQKVRFERSTVILLAPLWPAQAWYPILLSLMVEIPMISRPISWTRTSAM